MEFLKKQPAQISGLESFFDICYMFATSILITPGMKNWLFNVLLLCLTIPGFAQQDSITPPYKRFSSLPPLQVLLGDSTTIYTKKNVPSNKPVMVMIFSPECSHCQHETEEILAHKAQLKDVEILMVTFHPLWQMNEFVETYKLKEQTNIVVGKDIYLLLPGFYAFHNLPFHALYDKKGELLKVFEGSMDIEKIIESFKDQTN
jgi:thiol-disulfide isomerase/thioredoxin